MRFPDLAWAVRVTWLLTGLMWFVWLGVEDRGVAAILFLGTAISISAVLTGLDRWGSGRTLSTSQWWTRWIVFGLSIGISIGPLALLLMTVKVSLHAHGQPDFTLGDAEQLLQAWPVWGLGALLMGLGLGAFVRARVE